MCILIGDPSKGNSHYILMEHILGANDAKLSAVVNALSCTAQKSLPNFDKTCVKMLLSLGQSEREKANLKYAICKASDYLPPKHVNCMVFTIWLKHFQKLKKLLLK